MSHPRDNIHPAILANMHSTELASKGDKTAWLALYADHAVVQDPVGISPLDPSGEGHHGKTAIEAFWDTVIGPANITLDVKQRIISGPRHCAVVQQVTNDLGDGKSTTVDMMATYEVNEQGLIVAMSAYWDFDALMQQML